MNCIHLNSDSAFLPLFRRSHPELEDGLGLVQVAWFPVSWESTLHSVFRRVSYDVNHRNNAGFFTSQNPGRGSSSGAMGVARL